MIYIEKEKKCAHYRVATCVAKERGLRFVKI